MAPGPCASPLPQLRGRPMVTDGGLETDLIFHHGADLPHFAEVVRFYREGLGLPELGRFAGHAGYQGVMLGLPGLTYHLEFTQHDHGSPGLAPSRDNLLVLYFDDRAQVEQVATRLAALGHPPVEAENPYWTENGAVAVEDPDHWRVVLMPQSLT